MESSGQTLMDRPVPILLMSRSLGGGGSERQMTELARSLDRSRFTPHVGCFLATGFREIELRQAGVPLVEFAVRSFASSSVLRAAMHLGEYVRRHEIRLVHTFDVPANIFGVFASRWFRVPVVISSQRAFRSLTPGIYHHLLRVTDQLVDTVVVNSDVLRQQLIREDRVPPSKLRLCYNAVDTAVFHPDGPSMSDLLPAGLIIGSTSMLRPEKGVDTLIRAFARIHSDFPEAHLLLVGDGPCREELRALARDLDVLKWCHFAGEAKDVAPWLRTIDVFVLPSLSEALSNSLMEAMACGCAAIASSIGGNPELVEDHRTGFLFEPGNVDHLASKIRLLASDSDFRLCVAEAGRRFISRFSAAASVERFQELYQELLGAEARRTVAGVSGYSPAPAPGVEVGSKPVEVGQQQLRFGVVARGEGHLDPWQARAIRELLALPGTALVLHLAAPGGVSDAVDPLLAHARRLADSVPEPAGPSLDAIRTAGLDFVLQLEGEPLRGAVLSAPRFGVWVFEAGSTFWPVYRNLPVTEGRLARLGASRCVLDERRLATLTFSVRHNEEQLLESLAQSPARIWRLLQNGSAAGSSGATGAATAPEPEPAPLPWQHIALGAKLTARYIRAQLESLCYLENWHVGVVRAPIQRFLDPGFRPLIEWIPYSRHGRFLADPYLVADPNGSGRLVMEEFDYTTNVGRIVESQIEPGCVLSPPKPAFRESFHLSNPFLLEHGGTLYCIPESYQANAVRLYRWDSGRWLFETQLLEGFPAVDATLLLHDGHWWLFCTSKADQVNAALYVFHAESLPGPWRPHAANPVKVDVTSSRPGGTPFIENGHLYRPAQDCSKSYGWRLAINRIDRLTADEFAETTIHVLDPPNGFDGIHTLSGCGGYTVLDAKSIDFSMAFTGRRLAHKVRRLAGLGA